MSVSTRRAAALTALGVLVLFGVGILVKQIASHAIPKVRVETEQEQGDRAKARWLRAMHRQPEPVTPPQRP